MHGQKWEPSQIPVEGILWIGPKNRKKMWPFSSGEERILTAGVPEVERRKARDRRCREEDLPGREVM